MSRGRDWTKDRDRERIRRQGAEAAAGAETVGDIIRLFSGSAPAQRARKRPSKAAARAEAAALLNAPLGSVSRIIVCSNPTCGRRKTVVIPADRIGASFRCSACGTATR